MTRAPAARLLLAALACAALSLSTAGGGVASPVGDQPARANAPTPGPVASSATGAGTLPSVAVDAAGTAYIAWRGTGDPASLEFCRLPRGATACDARSAITAPGNTISRPFVVVLGARVEVAQFRYGGDVPGFSALYKFGSDDRGMTFAAGEVVGKVDFNEAVNGPGDTLSGVANASSIGGAFQNVPLGGGSSGEVYAQLWGVDHPYEGTVGMVDAATPLVVYLEGNGHGQFRRYDGSGDLNDAANWTPAVNLGSSDQPKLAGGPNGLFLFAMDLSAPPYSVYVRKWNGTTFGTRAHIASGSEVPLDAFQDAAGRLHLVYTHGRGPFALMHAVSDDGTNWRTGVATVLAGRGINDTRVAVAPDHIGVTVWSAGGNGGQIRVAAIGPDAPVKPTAKLSFEGTAREVDSGVRVSVQGTVTIPAALPKSAGCDGSVKVTIERGDTKVDSEKVSLSNKCTFESQTTLTRSQVKNADKLKVTCAFGGNFYIKGDEQTKHLTIR